MDAQVSTSGKRKSVSQESNDSDSERSSAKILVKEYAASKQVVTALNKTESVSNEMTVIISGRNRPMKHYHPTVVNKAILSIIGSYEIIKILPSGDLAITCKRQAHVKALLECDTLAHDSTAIPVKTMLNKSKPYGSRAVITGVPLEVTDGELMKSLSNECEITFVKRLKRKTDQGYVNSLSYLLCFKDEKPPDFVNFGYLRFSTKQYNPPPQRCYKCNRYGHKQDKCRSKPCCCKCGSRDHEYKDCHKEKKCVNCHGNHSAAYGGCSVYKQEAKIQVIRELSNLTYSQAKETLSEQTSSKLTLNSFPTNPRRLLYSRVAQNTQPDPSSKSTPTLTQQSDKPAQINNGQDEPTCSTLRTRDENPSEILHSISVSPLNLLAFITEVVQLAITAPRIEGNMEVLNIVSIAATKYLGYSIDRHSLQHLSTTPSNLIQS